MNRFRLYVIYLSGMILQGVAKAPRYPFLTSYVDDNVNKKNTAMYMGKYKHTAVIYVLPKAK